MGTLPHCERQLRVNGLVYKNWKVVLSFVSGKVVLFFFIFFFLFTRTGRCNLGVSVLMVHWQQKLIRYAEQDCAV